MVINLIEADRLSAFLLEAIKNTKGIVGYKLSRNLRMLNDELIEFNNIKLELFAKYGQLENEQYIINKNSDEYKKYCDELKQYENETVKVDFKQLTEEEIASTDLTGEQLYLLYDYMIKEEQDEQHQDK